MEQTLVAASTKKHFLLEKRLPTFHLVCWTQFTKSFMHQAPAYLLDPT